LTIPAFLSRAAGLLAALILSALKDTKGLVDGDGPGTFGPEVDRSPEKVIRDVSRLLQYGRVATLTFLIQGALWLKPALAALPIFPNRLATQLLDAIAVTARRVLEPLLDQDEETRYLWEIIDLVIASLKGSVACNLATKGFESINHLDSRQ